VQNQKQTIKLILLIFAILIGAFSLYFTNGLVKDLKSEEKKKIALWAKAFQELQSADFDQDITLLSGILSDNTTVPVILVNGNGEIISTLNIDSTKLQNKKYLGRLLEQMREAYPPIEIHLPQNQKNYVYYKQSTLLNKLFYYPFIQVAIISLFILVAYLAFSASKRAEQDRVWVGMSRETAHQLGTPISSLLAWIELLKLKISEDSLLQEAEKDVLRLKKISQRFSKIGSVPELKLADLNHVLSDVVEYLKVRSPRKIIYTFHPNEDDEIFAPINIELFEWVIENLCKNAIDAMSGHGNIDITVTNHIQIVYIDVSDTGKGIHKRAYKTIFQPGYTTKKRGWGLGLSLTKRIIEEYHKGSIFVKESELGKGTTFRIVLNKLQNVKVNEEVT
jgi:signal transduction histidine kinase